MPDLTISLTEEQHQHLQSAAGSTSSSPEELASSLLQSLLDEMKSTDDFQRAVSVALKKNERLYRRL